MYIATLLATLLDNNFSMFGYRFGISALIDLIPGIGDAVNLLIAGYIIWLAFNMGVPTIKIIQMLWNVLFSFCIGLIPIIGDAAYIFYKPNLRNLAILRQYHQIAVEGEIVT